MTISINHMIAFADDKQKSAQFLAELFGRPDPVHWGPFCSVQLDDGALVQFAEPGFEIQVQHYAFLVSEEEFDGIYERIREWSLRHWPDPQQSEQGTINHNHGGRGVYFKDPTGHNLEVLTRPYGSDG
ncbi:MAG: VOC family protein [Streptosporangiaceae bacterium]